MNKNFNFSQEPGKELLVPDFTNYKTIISIVTPSYNTTDYIFQTANCILNQTYPYFEWIVVDDGTTNKESLDRLKKLEKMDSRIKVLHKKNEGPAIARDYGVEKSDKNTEYVLFIDDDDLLEKTFIEQAYYTMSINKDATWCYCDVVNFDGFNSLWSQVYSSKRMLKENLLVNSAMIRKDAFLDVGGFKLEGKGLYEDWILWIKLIKKGYYPIHMSYYGFWYRKKKDSGEFNKANANKKKNLEMVKKYTQKVRKETPVIEFPRHNYDWDKILEDNLDFVRPVYKSNGKKNILVIIPWMTVGGADKFNLDLFKLLDKTKYNVILIVTQPTEYVWRQQFEAAVDQVYDLTTFLDRKDWLSFITYIIETRKIDLILNTNSVTGYAMIPYLHERYPEVPIMDYIHMEEWYNRNGGYSRDSASVSSCIDKTLFCNGGSEKIMNDYFGVQNKKTGTVYIGVDANKFDPQKYDSKKLKEKYNVPEDKFVIGLIARIDYQKRPYLLMRIIEELKKTNKIKNALFVIAGNGPLLNDIKKIADKNNLNDYVKFLGMTKTPDEIYAISDVTLNCSIKEGLALTSYESLSMGVPVVSCDVGGQKELIDEKTGVIVPCLQDETQIRDFDYSIEEINNYVEALIKVYDNIDDYKSKCRKRILDGFTINNMIDNMQKEMELVIKNHKIEDIKEKHLDVCCELLNYYYLENTEEYTWLCVEYYSKQHGVDYFNKHSFIRFNRFKDKMWEHPAWRLFVKSSLWKTAKKIIKR